MKRFFIILTFLLLILPFIILAEKLNVVCSTSDIADIVKNVGREKVNVIWLTDGTQDPHLVEPRPSMVMKVKNADLVCVVGMDLDMWMDGIIQASKNTKVKKGAIGYLDMSINIEKLEVPEGKIDGRKGDIHLYGNPHYHLDPENGIKMAEAIKERLKTLKPEDTEFFENNYKDFRKILQQKIIEWKKRIAVYKDKTILPTHNCWSYFLKAFNLKTVGFLEQKPGIQPSPKEIYNLVENMKKENTKIIIAEPFYPSSIIEKIAEQTNAKIIRIPTSVFGVEKANSYINLFEYNISELEKI